MYTKTCYKLVGGFDRVVSALEMKGKVVEARGHHLPPVWWRLDNRLTALVILLPLCSTNNFFQVCTKQSCPTGCFPLLTNLLCA